MSAGAGARVIDAIRTLIAGDELAARGSLRELLTAAPDNRARHRVLRWRRGRAGEPLQDLEARLDPARFVRIHRSAIVNIDRIRSVERSGPGSLTVVLDGGARLPVSRSRRPEIDCLLRGR